MGSHYSLTIIERPLTAASRFFVLTKCSEKDFVDQRIEMTEVCVYLKNGFLVYGALLCRTEIVTILLNNSRSDLDLGAVKDLVISAIEDETDVYLIPNNEILETKVLLQI